MTSNVPTPLERQFSLITGVTGVPMVLGHGAGSEVRQPSRMAIIGDLTLTQILTLFTTPVISIYLDRLRTGLPRAGRGRGSMKRVASLDDRLGDRFGADRPNATKQPLMKRAERQA